MKKFSKISTIVLTLVFMLSLSAFSMTAFAAVTPPDLTLGITGGYSVYGHAGITNTGAGTRVWGNVGGNGVGTAGFTSTQVPSGTIDNTTGTGTSIENDASSVYDSLMSGTQGTPTSLDLAGTHTTANGNPITPGVYTVGATTMNGAVELSGAGVYIFRSDSSATISTGSSAIMTLTHGATACNVWWAIPVAMTIGTGAQMTGTIIAQTGLISLGTGATLVGRAISLTKAVTLDTNQITQPTCVTPAPTPAAGAGAGANYWGTLPLIDVTKVPSPLALPSGAGPVTYTYTVTNIGKVPLSTVWVKDNKCAAVQYVSGDTNNDTKLDLTETWLYRCTKTVAATETNTATAHGYSNGIDVYKTTNATVVVGLPLIPPLIHIVKTPSVSALAVGGGVVTYTYKVTNPGVAPLSDVSVIDNKCTGLLGRAVGNPGDSNKNNLLDPGETWTFTCQSNLTQTTTNLATAEGHANGLTAIDYSTVTVLVASPKLPNTGYPTKTQMLWNGLMSIGTLVAVIASLAFIRSRRKI